MEKEVKKINSKKNIKNVRKINVEVENNDPNNETILDTYNRMKKVHIITTIVAIIVYIISFVTAFGGFGAMAPTTVDSFKEQMQTMLAFSSVIVVAGTVPYFYLSFGGIAEVMTLMGDFGARYNFRLSNSFTLFIGGIIATLGIALCVATGFYLCYLTTKKRKYYNASQFSMDDVKMQLYQIRKDENKIKEMEKKQIKKAKMAEKNNIKIPYLRIAIFGFVGYVIQMVGLLISKI